MAEYAWYVLIDEKQYGPYTLKELKGLSVITPDTLCRREGVLQWRPIRDVPELKELFEDEDQQVPSTDETPRTSITSEDLTLCIPQVEPPSYFWLILLIIVIAYAFFQIYF